jgi:hypothetical protein
VNDEVRLKFDQLPELIADAVDAIDAALEEKTRARVMAGHDKVNHAVRTYDEVLAAAEGERAQVEQRYGRRITDLRRQAARLPAGAMGRDAKLSVDAGSVPFIEQRAPGKSIQEIAGPGRRDARPKYTTGGEVDAWCGPCGGMRTHNIYALVGGEPQQVICQSCGARHGYRTTPARKAAAADGAPRASAGPSGPTREQLEQERRQKEQMALRRELADATEVRSFSPKERYKAGEIIEHPEHGRGKVENITRGSILVRFAHGLRPLDLS